MAYVLRPSKSPKPDQAAPAGYDFIAAPTIESETEKMDGGRAKIYHGSGCELELITGTTSINFAPSSDLSDFVPYLDRMKELIAFIKDNEKELTVMAERADNLQVSYEEEMVEYTEKMAAKRKTKKSP